MGFFDQLKQNFQDLQVPQPEEQVEPGVEIGGVPTSTIIVPQAKGPGVNLDGMDPRLLSLYDTATILNNNKRPIITDGGRTHEQNQNTQGSAPNSKHEFNEAGEFSALDWRLDSLDDPQAVVNELKKQYPDYRIGITNRGTAPHIHIEAPDRSENAIKLQEEFDAGRLKADTPVVKKLLERGILIDKSNPLHTVRGRKLATLQENLNAGLIDPNNDAVADLIAKGMLKSPIVSDELFDPETGETVNTEDIPPEILNSHNRDENLRLWKIMQTGRAERKPTVFERVVGVFDKSEQISAGLYDELYEHLAGTGKSEGFEKAKEGLRTLFDPRETLKPLDEPFLFMDVNRKLRDQINSSSIPEILGRYSRKFPALNPFPGLREGTDTMGPEDDEMFGKLIVGNATDLLSLTQSIFLAPDVLVDTSILKFGKRAKALRLEDGTVLSRKGEREYGRILNKIQTNRPQMTGVEQQRLAEDFMQQQIRKGGKNIVDPGGLSIAGLQLPVDKLVKNFTKRLDSIPVFGPGFEKARKGFKKTFVRFAGEDPEVKQMARLYETELQAQQDTTRKFVHELQKGVSKKDRLAITKMLDEGKWHLADFTRAVNKHGYTQQDIMQQMHFFFRGLKRMEKAEGIQFESMKYYLPHVMRNTDDAEQMTQILNALPSEVDPFTYHRKLVSLAQAKKLDLDPVLDPFKLMEIRANAAYKAVGLKRLRKAFSEREARLASQGSSVVAPGLRSLENPSPNFPDVSYAKVKDMPKNIQDVFTELSKLDLKTSLLKNPKRSIQLMGKALNVYDNINAFFRNNVTLLYPMFHSRNSFSNIVFNSYDIGTEIFDPNLHKQVGDIFKYKKFRSKFKLLSSDSVGRTEAFEASKLTLKHDPHDLAMVPTLEESRRGEAITRKFWKQHARQDLNIPGSYQQGHQRVVDEVADRIRQEIPGDFTNQVRPSGVEEANRLLKKSAKPGKPTPGGSDTFITNRFGIKYSKDDVVNFLEKYGVLTDYNKITDMLMERNYMQDMFGKIPIFKTARKVATRVENEGRVLNYLANLRRGHSPHQAAVRTKKYLLDYGNLSPIEREVIARVVPFYSFGRFNLELTGRALVESPAHVAAAPRFFQNIVGGMQDDDPTQRPDFLPNYVGSRGQFLDLGKDFSGGRRLFLTASGSPLEDITRLNSLWDNPVGNLYPTITLANDLLKVLNGDQITEGFFRDDISGRAVPINDKAAEVFRVLNILPDEVQNFIGYDEMIVEDLATGGFEEKIVLNKYMMHILKNFGFSRGVSTTHKFFDKNLSPVERVIALTGPISVKGFDEEDQKLRTEYHMEKLRERAEKQLTKNLDKEAEEQFGGELLEEFRKEAEIRGISLQELLKEKNKGE